VGFREAILTSVGEYLITEDPIGKADAIVVLSGSIPDRIMEAIDIYKGGYASLIVLTKEQKPEGYDELIKLGIGIPEGHDLNQAIALKLGVPESAIVIIDKRIDSTYSEAQVVYGFLKGKNLKSMILVTSKYHTRRAKTIFNHVTNGEIRVITRPSKYDSFDPKSWWRERRHIRWTVFEYEKLLHYYIFDWGTNN
jgi:uncharacterized SAM-binding protein YcdF (DUF218 family)